MTYERSAPSYLVSVAAHALVVGLIVLFTYVVEQDAPPPPKIFELVAGAGDNYGARAAPALGTLHGIKLTLPDVPAPPPPAPAQVEPAPAPPVPAATLTPAAPAQPVAKPVPDFARSVQRRVNQVAARIEKKYAAQVAAEKRKAMTQAEYLKEHPPKGEGIAAGVVGGSVDNKTGGAGGKALTREEGTELEAYFQMLKDRLQENVQELSDTSDALTAEVEFYVAADGSIGEVRISRSSGNEEFDRDVLEAFRRTHSIGPRPDHRGDVVKTVFRSKKDDAAP